MIELPVYFVENGNGRRSRGKISRKISRKPENSCKNVPSGTACQRLALKSASLKLTVSDKTKLPQFDQNSGTMQLVSP